MSLNINSKNNDYKYEMNDLSMLYYGAKFSYGEILEDQVTSYKLKRIITDYLLKDISPETTLESHFYYMSPEDAGDRSLEVYEQLKAKVRVSVPEIRKKLFGGEERIYKEKIIPVREFAGIPAEEKKRMGVVIQEIQISKLGLMTFTV